MPFQRRRKLHIPLAWDRVKTPRYSHKLMHRKRETCELHDSYFRSMMIKTCHSKDGGSGIFRWPFMGRDWVGVELLYNSLHRKFNQFRDKKSWRNDTVEKTASSRRGPRDPRLSSWRSDELEIRCGRENQNQASWAPDPRLSSPRERERNANGHKSGGQYVAVLFHLQLLLTHNPFK